MGSDPPCELLQWDSDFFGRRIARASANTLDKSALAGIEGWCDLHKIDCLYFLADPADPLTTRLAETSGFRLVDIRVTLDRPVQGGSTLGSCRTKIRGSLESDISALRTIARTSHRDSRFYFDGNFPAVLCDALYEAWIEKSCRGWAQNVLVAEDEGKPVGYVTCHLATGGIGRIGLVGVEAEAQSKGFGKELVGQSLHWFARQGVATVSVVTQGRNVRAQRLYQRCGFVTRSVDLWYHRWFIEKWRTDGTATDSV